MTNQDNQNAALMEAHIECRECSNCGHAGINDSCDKVASCHACDWHGDTPVDDVCPGCASTNVMGAACPKCHGLYELIAEANLRTSPAPQTEESDLPPLPAASLAAILHEASSNPHYTWADYSRWMLEASNALSAINKWAEGRNAIATRADLPPLPKPVQILRCKGDVGATPGADYYTTDQMLAARADLVKQIEELLKDKERLDFLTEFGSTWHVQWEQRPGKAARYRMIDDGEACGKWHDNPRAAIDTAMKEQTK